MKTKQIIPLLLLTIALIGCTTTAIKNAYNTLYSVEVTTTAAYDGYLTAVIKKEVSTNDVPKVSRAYNQFQTGMREAIVLAQYNWTNAAPESILMLSTTVLSAISEAKGIK